MEPLFKLLALRGLPIADPAMVRSRIGLRPTRSETLPQIGENTNWASE